MKNQATSSRVTAAIQQEDDNGVECLFSRASGTTANEDPRQARLVTTNGEPIDPETGEIKNIAADAGNKIGF